MTAPQQFLESFFCEKVAAYAEANVRLTPVYAKYFGQSLSEHSRYFMLYDRVYENIDEVKQSADSALVITSLKTERMTGSGIRSRYHLAAVAEEWKIIRIDRECTRCRVARQSGGTPCQYCGGEGWIDTTKPKV